VRVEPLVKTFDWYGGGWNFSPLGHRPGVAAGEIVPTYPMGLPVVMALTRSAFGDFGEYAAVPLLGAALVLGSFLLGCRLHSRTAGLVAAALVATSPVQLFHVVQPMSDVPAAAWLVLALAAALGDRWPSALGAGICLGMAAATRPNLAPLALAVAACAAGWPLQSWRQPRVMRLVFLGLGLVPVLGPLMGLNLWLYGSASSTGYGGLDQYFAWSNILPNVSDYFWRIAIGETPALWLSAAAVVILLLRRRRSATDSKGPGLRPSALVAAAVGALTLAVYLPYGIFPDWAYLRFLLPALAVAFVFVGSLAAEAAARLPEGARGVVLVVGMAVVCTANVVVATTQQVFNLRFYESRYRTVGHYLKETLPPNPIVITFQESGSIHYYTGAPISRWDYMPHDLEDHVSAFRQRGLHPIIVVEDWERPNLRARFPKSALAALDWTPRADIGETTHVWILDPADRQAGTPPVTDRFK
jgi:4-amino-4-deoxy-L-arabinose transferase-like glycosyltransferase